MLTMVTAQNVQSGTLQLPLMDSSGGYVIKDIQGLDPVKATLVSSSMAQMDGAQLHNKRREPRNILMKLGLQPDYVSNSVASLRTDLYDYFMPKTDLSLGFYVDDSLYVVTDAVVESMENNMFSADPEVDVSLICYDPDFYAPEPTHADGVTTAGTDTTTITYEGTSDTGIVFDFTFPANASELRLYNTRPDDVINMFSIQNSFLTGDVIHMDSNPGRKLLTMTRAGVTSSILYCVDSSSTWISLMRGNNLFRAYYNGSSTAYNLEYTAKHGGF